MKPSETVWKWRVWTLLKGHLVENEHVSYLMVFKWNRIKARPATLSTASQCELCWKIYFGDLGLSIQREKTDWCSDINQAMAWWLCKWRFRVHGLKTGDIEKKKKKKENEMCRGMAKPGAECCYFLLSLQQKCWGGIPPLRVFAGLH